MEKTLREVTIEGVVDRIDEEEATVILDINGEDIIRYISDENLKDLRKAGIEREGQCFDLHGREYELDGERKLESWFTPVQESKEPVQRVDMFPDLDVSKFRRTSKYQQ